MSTPDFDRFAADPLAYAKGGEVEPTEAQERVARELTGMRNALEAQGWTREDATTAVTGMFALMAAGEEFTL